MPMKTNMLYKFAQKKNSNIACPAYLVKCKASQLTFIPHEIYPTTNQYLNILSDP